jgi:hypothetical protein
MLVLSVIVLRIMSNYGWVGEEDEDEDSIGEGGKNLK